MKTIVSNRLDEIDIIRCLVIICLVLYHSFAPFCNSWSWPLSESKEIPLYFWYGKFAYSGMLETFVFILGVVYAFSTSNKSVSLCTLIKKKFHRLYIPAIVWGTIWLALFSTLNNDLVTLFRVISGSGHLWFLSMLFWCFIFELFIGKYITKRYLLQDRFL